MERKLKFFYGDIHFYIKRKRYVTKKTADNCKNCKIQLSLLGCSQYRVQEEGEKTEKLSCTR